MTIDNQENRKLTKFLPSVRTRKGETVFEPGLIYQSLRRETELLKEEVKTVTKQVVRFLIGANLKLITAPIIREVVNVHLLKLGFEKGRSQYTRIGLPFYDLKQLFSVITQKGFRWVMIKIIKWIISEFKAVGDLIKSYN